MSTALVLAREMHGDGEPSAAEPRRSATSRLDGPDSSRPHRPAERGWMLIDVFFMWEVAMKGTTWQRRTFTPGQ